MEDSMSTPIQALQNNQPKQGPPPPSQTQEKKVTFQQQPPNMKNAPHRMPKQETSLPHPDIGSMPVPPMNSPQQLMGGSNKNSETEKGLKIPDQHNNDKGTNNDLINSLKEAGIVVLLSSILFSLPVQDCLMSIVPGGKHEGRPTIVVLLISSLVLGAAVFLSNKFLL